MTEHNHSSGPPRLYSRPANRSFEAYKAWITAVVLALNPAATANDQGKLSEAEWKAQWRNFWAAADASEPKRSDNDSSDSSESKADEVQKFLLAHGFKPIKGVSGVGIVGGVRASQPGGKPTIRRRNFLALLPALPPVCKAMLAHNVEWEQFARELSRALRNLRKGDFLIIRTTDQYYVQFAGAGGDMRAEAVSNGYLQDERRLSEKACSRLVKLGWNAPTIIPDPISDRRGYKAYGSPNYFLDLDMPVPYGSVANLAVVTLRSTFGARHWGELHYLAFAERGGDIEFPNLRIARARTGHDALDGGTHG